MRNAPKNLRDVDRAFISTVMFEHGIIPMEQTDLDMRRALEQLSPEEARALRRKFRKLWRRAMKQTPTGSAKSKRLRLELGVGKQVPSRRERNARKKLVFDQLWKEDILPLIERFEAAKESGD